MHAEFHSVVKIIRDFLPLNLYTNSTCYIHVTVKLDACRCKLLRLEVLEHCRSVMKEICARMKSCMSSNLQQYHSFLLIYSPLILKTVRSAHALPREIWHAGISFLTRKSFSESYVLRSARKG